jgi:predicted enzyme related to lactoylglutathione lyase
MSEITASIPVLPAVNIDEVKKYYDSQLGFKLTADYGDYLIFRRDSAELHVIQLDDPRIAEKTSCYLRVQEIDKLHDEYQRQGVVRAPLESKPWGMREFAVVDCAGNLLRFGERIQIKS